MHLKIIRVTIDRMVVVALCAAWDVVCGTLLVVAGIVVSSEVVVVSDVVIAGLLFVTVVVGFAVLVVARVDEDTKAPL